jgi:putative flippase GtrA
LTRFTNHEFFRFVIVGLINTVLSYGIYVLSLSIVTYLYAYTFSFVCGIIISYSLNTRYVYRVRMAFLSALQYPLVYVAQYVLGISATYLLVHTLHTSEFVAPIIVILVNTPFGFFLTRFVIKGRLIAESR